MLEGKFLYLIINIATIFFPLALSFDKKVHFYKKLKYFLPSLSIVALFFIIWDQWFTQIGVWSFNPDYISGIHIANLPFEECLFFITVPYACIFIYESLLSWFKWNIPDLLIRLIVYLISITLIILSIYFVDKMYTSITLFLTGFFLMIHYQYFRSKILNYFIPAFIITLIPFFIVNGILTAKPVVLYNDLENLGIRMGSIPVEDAFYGFLLLLLNVSIYEFIRLGFNKNNQKLK